MMHKSKLNRIIYVKKKSYKSQSIKKKMTKNKNNIKNLSER